MKITKIDRFSKEFTKEGHFYKFALSGDDGNIIIKLSSISQDVVDKALANRLDFLMQKYNTCGDVYLNENCRNGYCERQLCYDTGFCSCQTSKSTSAKLKITGVANQTNGGFVEHHMYFAFDDKKNYRMCFVEEDSPEDVADGLHKLANEIEAEYG